jgi:hypothetical protein
MMLSDKLKNIKRSITEIPHDEAIQLILDIRESRRTRKYDVKKKQRTKTKSVKKISASSIQNKIGKMTEKEQEAIIKQLEAMKGKL